MLLVGEARHRVVGLRLEMGARDAPFGGSAQHRQLAPAIRLSMSAVMKTVLPARDSPVTPSRRPPPERKSASERATTLASKARSVKTDKARPGRAEDAPI